MGIRLFDLRWVIDGDMTEPYIFHGPYKAEKLEVSFQQIRQFMDENPLEFFVLSLQCEHNNLRSLPQYDTLFGLIQKYFGDVAISRLDSFNWFNVKNTTLGEI